MVGKGYSLTCSVTGTNVSMYLWMKDSAILPNETGPALSFSFLRLSQAGQYSCNVSISPNAYRVSRDVDVILYREILIHYTCIILCSY